ALRRVPHRAPRPRRLSTAHETSTRHRMITLENPPGFVVRTEAQQAAWDNGYRLGRDIDGGWLHYASTTAPGSIWVAGCSGHGPWLLSIAPSRVAAEVGSATGFAPRGPCVARLP